MSVKASVARATLAVSLALTPAGLALAQTPVHLVVVDVAAVALGYRVSSLVGRPVQNDRGETVGRIDDMIIGQDKVLFTILSVGGFLGIGDHKVVAPYKSLRVTPNKIVWPGATRQAVRALPEFHYR